MKKFMNPATINTILNSAPVIIQAASKLVRLIKERQPESDNNAEKPVTMEQLQDTIEKIETRLDGNDEANLEQIKLIEQLARQNELLATAQQRSMQKINLLFIFVLLALTLGFLGFFLK